MCGWTDDGRAWDSGTNWRVRTSTGDRGQATTCPNQPLPVRTHRYLCKAPRSRARTPPEQPQPPEQPESLPPAPAPSKENWLSTSVVGSLLLHQWRTLNASGYPAVWCRADGHLVTAVRQSTGFVESWILVVKYREPSPTPAPCRRTARKRSGRHPHIGHKSRARVAAGGAPGRGAGASASGCGALGKAARAAPPRWEGRPRRGDSAQFL
jgi:hypothetical protein